LPKPMARSTRTEGEAKTPWFALTGLGLPLRVLVCPYGSWFALTG
jgi:hypothetical protein